MLEETETAPVEVKQLKVGDNVQVPVAGIINAIGREGEVPAEGQPDNRPFVISVTIQHGPATVAITRANLDT